MFFTIIKIVQSEYLDFNIITRSEQLVLMFRTEVGRKKQRVAAVGTDYR